MKRILRNISVLALIVGLVGSCTDDDDNYDVKILAPSSNLNLTATTDFDVDGVTPLEGSFRANFTAQGDGVAYYAVFPGGSGSPTIETLIRQTASTFGEGKVSLTAGSAETIVISDGVRPGYPYDVHAVMTGVDGRASTVIKVASFTTPDTTVPLFLPDTSVPQAFTGEYSPFGLDLTLNFSEDVFYNGGDITLTGFFDGLVVVLTSDNYVSGSGTTNISFSTNDLLGVDDFMLVSFDAGTFTDNVGLEVAAVGGFDYYFKIRAYTFEEVIENSLTGLYDFTITDFSGALPLVPDGQYTVVSDGDELTLLNGAATAVGASNEFVLRVENDDDGDGVGFLFATENPQPSVFGCDGCPAFYWHPWYNYLFTSLAGFYDFSTGEIIYLMDFADELGFNGAWYFGYHEYNMLPASTRSSRPDSEGLRNHPVVKKYFEDMEAYRLSQGIVPNAGDRQLTH